MGILRKIERAKNCYFGENINGIKHYNWHKADGSWLGDFLHARFTPEECKKVSIVSVFGSARTFWFHKDENKIFFTGENPDRYPNYKNHALPHVKLSMGFDYLSAENYLRFPLWIMYLFKPESTYEDIKKIVDEINNLHPEKTDFCSLVCRHGGDDNLRGKIFEAVSSVAEVKCAGKFMHNDDRLWKEYNNSKQAYLRNFKFNICPENSNRTGYVTEKLFEAFRSGVVPIYWGSDNNPEPGLINKDAVIFWNPEGDNQAALAKIKELSSSAAAYREFVSQPRFTPELVEYVWSRFHALEQRVREMIKK